MKMGLALMAATLMMVSQAANAEKFECAFLQERMKGGKSNGFSCSMMPEVAYLTNAYIPKRNEHCNIEERYSFENYVNFIADTANNLVVWETEFGIIDEAKPDYMRYLIKEGVSAKEAKLTADKINRESTMMDIKNHHIQNEKLYFDMATKKVFDEPKLAKAHFVSFGNKSKHYQLYIPEVSGHAILTSYHSMTDYSAVELKFGRCRLIG